MGTSSQSLPLWERGLKFDTLGKWICQEPVAPLVGAWIEISHIGYKLSQIYVAPLVGAWIEISS